MLSRVLPLRDDVKLSSSTGQRSHPARLHVRPGRCWICTQEDYSPSRQGSSASSSTSWTTRRRSSIFCWSHWTIKTLNNTLLRLLSDSIRGRANDPSGPALTLCVTCYTSPDDHSLHKSRRFSRSFPSCALPSPESFSGPKVIQPWQGSPLLKLLKEGFPLICTWTDSLINLLLQDHI